MIAKRKLETKTNLRYLTAFFILVFHLCSAQAEAQAVFIAYDSESSLGKVFVSKLKQDLDSFTLFVYDYRELKNDLFLSHQDALLVTIGTNAARKATSLKLPIQIIHTLISRSALYHLSFNKPLDNNVTAIVLDQPVSRLLSFSKLLLGNVDKLSMIVGKSSRPDFKRYEIFANDRDIELSFSDLSTGKSDQLIRELISSKSPIIALPDRETLDASNVKLLLYLAYQSRIPVIGFSSSFVSAGAIGAVFTTPDLVALQTIELISRWHAEKGILSGEIVAPKYYQVELNMNVARALRIVVEDAATITEKLKKMESNP